MPSNVNVFRDALRGIDSQARAVLRFSGLKGSRYEASYAGLHLRSRTAAPMPQNPFDLGASPHLPLGNACLVTYQGPSEVLWSFTWATAWYFTGQTTMGEGLPDRASPFPGTSSRRSRAGGKSRVPGSAGRGAAGGSQACGFTREWWERGMERFTTYVSECCDCPPGCRTYSQYDILPFDNFLRFEERGGFGSAFKPCSLPDGQSRWYFQPPTWNRS